VSRTGTYNGEPYSVPDGCMIVSNVEWERVTGMAMLVSDLDRCVHGRHATDGCSYCAQDTGGMSTGNLLLPPGTRIGTTMTGLPIVVPHSARYKRDNWVCSPDEVDQAQD
jgi:hypothetical protein